MMIHTQSTLPLMLACLALLSGPSLAQHDHGHGAKEEHDKGDKKTQILARGDGYEIFIEHAYPVAGEKVKFVTHVTDLEAMQPRTEGALVFSMSQGGVSREQTEKAPARPGIYTPMLEFAKAGAWEVTLRIPTAAGEKRVGLPTVTVYPSDEAAEKAPEWQEPEGFSLLKEQTWLMPFKTEPAVLKEGKLTVPEGAVIAHGEKAIVFVQAAGEIFQKRAVTVSKREGGRAYLDSGLEKDEWVVTRCVEAANAASGQEEFQVTFLTPEAVKGSGIRIETLARKSLAATFSVPARVSFNLEAQAHVGVPIPGRIAELKVQLGSIPMKGDVLAVVDSPELGEAQSDYLQKRTLVRVALSAMEVARTTHERAQKLLEGKGISFSESLKREAEFKAAQGNLFTAEAAVTAAENKLHLFGMTQAAVDACAKTGEIGPRYEVRAPISGEIISREATLGEIVRPEGEPLMILADLSTFWVLADVPELRITSIAAGAPARINLPALGGSTIEGKVAYIAPMLKEQNRTIEVRIEVPASAGPLRPGMFGEAELSGSAKPGEGALPQSIVVPEIAIQTIEGSPSVFLALACAEGVFYRRPVKIGTRQGRWVSVLEGLEEGQRVVTEGSYVLKADIGKAGAEHDH